MPDGKVIDTWYYERGDNARIPIQVRLTKVARDDKYDVLGERNRPPFETLRVALNVELDGQVLSGTDVESLRQAVWAELDKKYAIQWIDYYLVTVKPERPYEGMGTGFTLGYEDVQKGLTWDGKELLRRIGHRGYIVSPWPGQFTDRNGNIQACLPATKENRKGLEEFVDRVATLRELIRKFLESERFEDNLRQLATTGTLLPPVDRKLLESSTKRKQKR
jgi:hypothetical protein